MNKRIITIISSLLYLVIISLLVWTSQKIILEKNNITSFSFLETIIIYITILLNFSIFSFFFKDSLNNKNNKTNP